MNLAAGAVTLHCYCRFHTLAAACSGPLFSTTPRHILAPSTPLLKPPQSVPLPSASGERMMWSAARQGGSRMGRERGVAWYGMA